jgi:hypothetical protein
MPSQKFAWINCRDDYQDSLELGDVVVEDIHIWDSLGGIPSSGKIIGRILHGTKVTVLDKGTFENQKVAFYQVSADDIEGWVDENFVVWNWSSFTFIGDFKPAEACRGLNLNIEDMGIIFSIRDNRFAIVTEGAPEHFEIIVKAVYRFVNRIINALAPFKKIALQADFSTWVELPIDRNNERQEIVGFLAIDDKDVEKISNSDIKTAHSIIPKLKLNPYFDLALNDFYQALRYPQHALIFLARSIESVEKNFSKITKKKKGKSKYVLMCDVLGVKKRNVEYVTKRANESHRRHASSDGKIANLSADELGKCFKISSNILVAFANYLELIYK